MITFMIIIMIKLNVHEIKRHFSKFLELVEEGETVVVCKRNVPVAEIRRISKQDGRVPVLGSARGTFEIPSDFDASLSDEELALWEEGSTDDLLPRAPSGE